MSDTQPTAQAPPASAAPPPTLLQILASFSLISLYGFGGVLAWSRRMLVEERRWLTAEEFNEAFALCQFLPGPNIINLAVVFGSRVRGSIGSAIALIGLLGPPLVIVTGLGALYAYYGEVEAIGRGLTAVAAAAAGLLIATVIKMAGPIVRNLRDLGWVVALAAFVAVGPLGLPLPIAFAVLAPLSLGLSWWMRR